MRQTYLLYSCNTEENCIDLVQYFGTHDSRLQIRGTLATQNIVGIIAIVNCQKLRKEKFSTACTCYLREILEAWQTLETLAILPRTLAVAKFRTRACDSAEEISHT